MSALGQKRPFVPGQPVSAFAPKRTFLIVRIRADYG